MKEINEEETPFLDWVRIVLLYSFLLVVALSHIKILNAKLWMV